MPSTLENVMELARRRGFFWPAYEPYGGAAGLFVFGNLGVRMAGKIADLWRSFFLRPYDFVEVDTPSLVPAAVLEASGHVSNFKDPMAECMKCHRKYRADHLLKEAGSRLGESATIPEIEAELSRLRVKCPECHSNEWSVRPFLNMFETRLGPYAEAVGYLRPETAQGTFVEFKRIFETERQRLPIGVAQVGRGFRNEISPRQGIVRLRELHMMELEVFVDPEDMGCVYLKPLKGQKLRLLTEKARLSGLSEPEVMTAGEAVEKGVVKTEWLAFLMCRSAQFLEALGVPAVSQMFVEKLKDERAHYSAQTFDHEVEVGELGWVEVAGLAYRTDFDLRAHMAKTGVDYSVSVQLEKPSKTRVKRWSIDVEKLKGAFPDEWKSVMKEYSQLKDREGEPPRILAGVNLAPSFFRIKEEEAVVNARKFVPHVIEPAFGLDRLMLATLFYGYTTKEERVVLKVPGYVAPLEVGVFPLVVKEGMAGAAKEISLSLRRSGMSVFYDESGSVGRRYARADEAGVPYSVTVDGQTEEDGTVTVRDRNSWEQVRVQKDRLVVHIGERLRAPGDGAE